MLEVSSRILQAAIQVLRLGNLDVDALSSDLALTTQDPLAGFVNWSSLVTLLDRAADALGGTRQLEELTDATFAAAVPESAHLMALGVDQLTGIQLVNAFIDATFFTHLRYPLVQQSSQLLSLPIRLPDDDGIDARNFFALLAGGLRGGSRHTGASIGTRLTVRGPNAADYELKLAAPVVAPSTASELAEQAARREFMAQCQVQLVQLRGSFLDLHHHVSRAASSRVFESLSGVVADCLVGQTAELMPQAAARAISRALGAHYVKLQVSIEGAPASVHAQVGERTDKAARVEAATALGTLTLEASVGKSSPEAAALERLAPWLALVVAPGGATARRSADWEGARVGELAKRWRLTPRQRQVLLLMAQGESNKSIAQRLACGPGTVELHAHAVLLKANLPSRAALAARFYAGD